MRGATPRHNFSQGNHTTPRAKHLILRKFTFVMMISLFICTLGYGVYLVFARLEEQKINTVVVEGSLRFLRREELTELVQDYVQESLVSIDLKQLKQKLEAQPWVSQVSLQRQWPDKLIISIREETAIARWGEKALLNQEGQSFEPESGIEGLMLPRLSGPAGSEALVMSQYRQFNQLIYPLGMRISTLQLNSRGAWTLKFSTVSDGLGTVNVKIGSKDLLQRIQRLVSFLQLRGASLINLSDIDLRYKNGLATRSFISQQVATIQEKPDE
jgi:cell division protein FtsQ